MSDTEVLKGLCGVGSREALMFVHMRVLPIVSGFVLCSMSGIVVYISIG